MNRIKNTLRMLDKAFIADLWESTLIECEGTKKKVFGIYMKNIAMPQYRGFTWDDSNFTSEKGDSENSYEDYTDSDLMRLSKFWGSYSEEDYRFLEEFYGDYTTNYSSDTPSQRVLYKNIAKTHLQAEKALSSDKIKEYKDLMELSSKLHNDGNIKPVQATGGERDAGLSTYGLWIKEIEQEEPCEFFDKREKYADYDGFKKYVENWLLRPMKNIFNISKDFNVKD